MHAWSPVETSLPTPSDRVATTLKGLTGAGALRVLHLEDDLPDREIVRAILETEGIACEIHPVETRDQFLAALQMTQFDLILSDLTLPAFDGLLALAVAKEKCPDVPYIFVSGSMGEEAAIETIKNGATDYVLKDRLARLAPAVRRAVAEAKERQQRKRAEEDLRKSEERFRQIAENVADLIAVLDRDGRRIYNNPAYEAVLGLPDELKGTDSFNEVHPEDRERIRRIFREIVESGVSRRAEFRFLLKDGSMRYIESQGSLVRDAEGKAANVIVVSRDITERQRAEEQIREQAALLDKARDAICVTDMEQAIVFWNKSAESLYGWTVTEAVGRNANELLFKGDTTRPREALKSLIAKREWSGELNQIAKDGREIVVESRWTLVQDNQGRPRSILIINTDITAKKKLEAQFLRVQRMESIGTLAGGIAHDLNNVLAPILMGAQLIRMKLADADCLRILGSIEASAQRGTDMVRQVLSFARGVEGERSDVQLRHVITEQEKIAHETFPRSIRMRKIIGENLWTVMGDATQLFQVLMNLCVNARDAMPNGGTLEIEAANVVLDDHSARMHVEAKPGPYVVVSVSDTGTGIPPHILDKIFDPFFTTKESGKGTGLGLSTVVGIVKSHGGFVNAYSEVGKGTQFKVYLPAVESADTQQVLAVPPDLPPGNGELVLVADDELTIREITRSTLETYGYRVLTANDGTEVMAAYAQHKNEIKLVITDMSMPFLDGAATIRALRKLNPEVKIIAVSGLLDNARSAVINGNGTVKFLQKPYTMEKLLTLIHEMLAGGGTSACV